MGNPRDAVAEAWASIDGKLELYEAERDADEITTGHFVGYQAEAAELIKRIEQRGFVLVPKP